MKVKKRDGSLEEVDFNKIQKRLKDLSKDLNIDIPEITQKMVSSIYDGVSTKELDDHLATTAVNYDIHPDYNTLAGRICSSSLHKETALNHFTEYHEEKLFKLLKKGEVGEDNRLVQKFQKALFDDKEREDLLEKVLKGNKVKEKDLVWLCKVPRFFYVIKTMHQEGIINKEVLDFTKKHRKEIEEKIDYNRDFMFDFFGMKTLEKAYLIKKFSKEKVQKEIKLKDENDQLTGESFFEETEVVSSEIIERPQDLFMRVAIGVLRRVKENPLERVFELYDMLSEGYYTHATPTLFNAGTKREQMSSCFLLQNEGDSIEGIFGTFTEEALISKNSGGIGVAVSNIRSRDSVIKGTNGKSNGIIPFLKMKNEIARGVNQGGKRKGSIAVYLEPWHADVEEFIRLKRPDGAEEERARDLFLALWIPDLFFKRVEEGGKWSLFDPATAPGLQEVYGDDFVKLYEKYEKEGRAKKVLDAREFQKDIYEMQIETGVPYILNKDQCNLKSNQQNLGTIKSSNLCTEIVEYTDEVETAVCNLASVCLSKFVENKKFNFKKLHQVVQVMTKNLNEVIDINYYVNEKTKKSNFRHRPIGIGVQGLADVFFLMEMGYTSKEAQDLNEAIFETIYHGSLTASLELAKKDGHYESMKENGGAPITKGILQFDMWNHEPRSGRYSKTKNGLLSWDDLKEEIKKHGLRNSLLVAPMPTASTAIIFGNCASFEPETQNLYKRKTISGEFLVANKYLIKALEEMGLWSSEMKRKLIIEKGSVQNIKEIPEALREVYKTVWELKLKPQIDMAADRGAYICQSQSFNVHMESPSMSGMKNFYMYAWKKGLKTMSYYFRTTAAAENQSVTARQTNQEGLQKTQEEEDDDCLVCGS